MCCGAVERGERENASLTGEESPTAAELGVSKFGPALIFLLITEICSCEFSCRGNQGGGEGKRNAASSQLI